MCFWNRIEESKQDGSREEYMSVSKFHSRHQFFSWLFELLPSYPASSPEFPVDSDFPGMVYVLYMLQYPSFSTNLPISSLYRPANAEGSQSFEYVALLKPMRRFHICIQCGDHNIFLLLWHIYFLMAGKSLLWLGRNDCWCLERTQEWKFWKFLLIFVWSARKRMVISQRVSE